jgi:hypothetical protein
MCDPLTLTALTVAATVVTAGSQIYAGQAAAAQGKFEGQIAERNAKLEEASKADAIERRNTEQMRLWRRVTQRLGEQRATAAASGLDVNFGSIADLQEDTLMIGMEDSSALNENFTKEIKGYDINASNYRMEGAAARYRGKSARFGSYLAATGTLLAGATQVGKMHAQPGSASFTSGGGSSGGSSASYGSPAHYRGGGG